MTWTPPTQRAADHDADASRLSCDATRPNFVGETLRRRGTVPCQAAVIGFPSAPDAREVALDAGWTVTGAADHCPAHRRT